MFVKSTSISESMRLTGTGPDMDPAGQKTVRRPLESGPQRHCGGQAASAQTISQDITSRIPIIWKEITPSVYQVELT